MDPQPNNSIPVGPHVDAGPLTILWEQEAGSDLNLDRAAHGCHVAIDTHVPRKRPPSTPLMRQA
jgi:hypothetical protein